MYTEYYALREKPFSLEPDPRFFFLARTHREALAHVHYGVDQGEGFIAVTGEIGTGKTLLCRRLLAGFQRDTELVCVLEPALTGPDFLRSVCASFGLPVTGRTRSELNDALNRALLAAQRKGRRSLLVVDGAQDLPDEALEEIRLLSNFETSTFKLIQIVLFGRPALDAKLDSPALRQLRQRISVRWRLGVLGLEETAAYVRHRLDVAGAPSGDLFSERALRELHRRGRGIPRLINAIADRSLALASSANASRVDRPHVGRATLELLDLGRRQRQLGVRWPAALGGAAAGIALAALALWQWSAQSGPPQPDLPDVAGGPPIAEFDPPGGSAPSYTTSSSEVSP